MNALHARTERHKIQMQTRDAQFVAAMYNKNAHLTYGADEMPTGHQATHKKTNTTSYSETVDYLSNNVFLKIDNSREILKKPFFLKIAYGRQKTTDNK